MNFFICKKNYVSFTRYLDFCVFDEYRNLKIHDVTRDDCTLKVTLSIVSLES